MSKIHAAITAVNGYVPDYVMTNKEMESFVDTSDEWIVSRTGIKERRILKGEGLGTSDMAVPAVEGLLKKRGITALELDLIIFCT
ncbi:MAG: 3-oxoacyl-ACP synthase, partial [Chitinophagaceae bacterium]